MRFTEFSSKDSCPVCGQTPCNCTHVAEAVTFFRTNVPNYPRDPKTIQHRIATAKEILSDPKSDPESRREAAAIIAQAEKQGAADDESLDENLRKWFKEKWVRFGPDGKIRGDCARGDDSEGKPKCLPQAKAHALGKKGRASAAARKRREDPNPERRGPAKNVATKKESIEETQQQCPECGGPMFPALILGEKQDACYYKVKSRYKVWPSAYASGALVQCRKKGAANWGNKK